MRGSLLMRAMCHSCILGNSLIRSQNCRICFSTPDPLRLYLGREVHQLYHVSIVQGPTFSCHGTRLKSGKAKSEKPEPRPSKNANKREALQIREVAVKLVEMTRKQTDLMAPVLSEELSDELRIAQSMPKRNEAHKRQVNHVAKLLRQLDDEESQTLQEALTKVKNGKPAVSTSIPQEVVEKRSRKDKLADSWFEKLVERPLGMWEIYLTLGEPPQEVDEYEIQKLAWTVVQARKNGQGKQEFAQEAERLLWKQCRELVDEDFRACSSLPSQLEDLDEEMDKQLDEQLGIPWRESLRYDLSNEYDESLLIQLCSATPEQMEYLIPVLNEYGTGFTDAVEKGQYLKEKADSTNIDDSLMAYVRHKMDMRHVFLEDLDESARDILQEAVSAMNGRVQSPIGSEVHSDVTKIVNRLVYGKLDPFDDSGEDFDPLKPLEYKHNDIQKIEKLVQTMQEATKDWMKEKENTSLSASGTPAKTKLKAILRSHLYKMRARKQLLQARKNARKVLQVNVA